MFILALLGVVNNAVLIFVLGADHDHHGHDHGHGHGHGHGHHHHHHSKTSPESADCPSVPHDEEAGGSDSDDDHHDHHEGKSLAVRAAVVHFLGDSVQVRFRSRPLLRGAAPMLIAGLPPNRSQAIGVLVASILIWTHQGSEKWAIADPIATIIFAVMSLSTFFNISRDIIAVLMEAAPENALPDKIQGALLRVPGVLGAHDIHIWQLTPGKTICTVHLEVDPAAERDVVLGDAEACLRKQGLDHVTIQVERPHIARSNGSSAIL